MDERGIPIQSWRQDNDKGDFLVSTDLRLLDYDFINKAFASEDMHWAKPLPTEQLKVLLQQSQTLGLYRVLPSAPTTADSPSSPRTPSPTVDAASTEHLEQIGMARFITDHMTTAYLTDVFLEPQYRQEGLGKWMIGCCREVIAAMPALRRAFLLTSTEAGKRFYSRELGFWDMDEERDEFVAMTRNTFSKKR